MTPQQINKLKALDPHGLDGTIQTVLLRSDLNQTQFADACFFLAEKLKGEKQTLMDENQKLVKILKSRGLYTSEILFGE
jgi:hypothetical protein